jgi:hypothetical protein
MQLIATRQDDWQLYKAGEQYFESCTKLDEAQLSSNGGELLRNAGALKQLSFNQDSVKGWFNKSEAGDALQSALSALEPIIIESWKQNKLNSWILETY